MNLDNFKSYEYINAPMAIRQLIIDIENLEKLIKKSENEGKSKVQLCYYKQFDVLCCRVILIHYGWSWLIKKMSIKIRRALSLRCLLKFLSLKELH